MFKTCTRCGVSKPLSGFALVNAVNSFKGYTTKHHSYCKECNNTYAKAFRARNPGYQGTGRISSIPTEDRRLMSAVRQRLTDAKVRCKKLGKNPPVLTDLFLYQLFLSQNRRCALTGATLKIEIDHPLCLSLDQIDPANGYVEGNVQWLAWAVNRAKGDLSLDHFYEMCEVVLNNRKVQRLSNGSAS
jgi:hypothetical protein